MVNESFIIFNITHNCNLSCSYCYYAEEMEKTRLQMSLDVVEASMKNFAESSYDTISIVFHGGEPLTVKKEFYNKVFEISRKHLEKKKVSYSLQTNLTLLTDDAIDMIRENNIELGISFDGPAEIHDHYRHYKNGDGSYEIIFDNVRRLQRENVEFNILAVLSDITIKNIEKIYPFLKSLGPFKGIDYLCPDISGHNSSGTGGILSQGNFALFIKHMFKEWFYDKECSFEFRILTELVLKFLELPTGLCVFKRNCYNGKNIVSIDPLGDVYHCDNSASVCMGNITEKPLESFVYHNLQRMKYAKVEEKRLESCLFCEWNHKCNGGCPVNYLNDQKRNYYCNDFKEMFSFVKDELTKNHVLDHHGKWTGSLENIKNTALRSSIESTIKRQEKD